METYKVRYAKLLANKKEQLINLKKYFKYIKWFETLDTILDEYYYKGINSLNWEEKKFKEAELLADKLHFKIKLVEEHIY